MSSITNNVAIIGAGPAGLMAAEVLAQGGAGVTVYDAMPSAGRKFLMAGRGGLNLTHSEPLPAFLARYAEAMPHLAAAIDAFPPQAVARVERSAGAADLRRHQWSRFSKGDEGLTIAACVAAAAGSRWACGWRCGIAGPAGTSDDRLRFQTPDGERLVEARATVLALGGASWPRLGSDGAWVEALAAKSVTISPLRPANSGFTVMWSDIFRDRFEGQPLKGVALTFGPHTIRGEAIITRTGIEGGAIYALSAESARGHHSVQGRRRSTSPCGPISRSSDLDRAIVSAERQAIPVELSAQGRASLARRNRIAAGGGQGIRRLRYRRCRRPISLARSTPSRSTLTGVAPIARAISTAGGISFEELDADFMLRRLPGVFAAGEMLDWEAPTGGYLLQASFATGAAAGRGA